MKNLKEIVNNIIFNGIANEETINSALRGMYKGIQQRYVALEIEKGFYETVLNGECDDRNSYERKIIEVKVKLDACKKGAVNILKQYMPVNDAINLDLVLDKIGF